MWKFGDSGVLSFVALAGGVLAFVSVIGAISEDEDDANDPSHGLGKGIAWTNLKEGFADAKEENMPLMLIIHKSWCGACRALKPKLRVSQEFKEMTKNFIMVNTLDDEEPPEELYRPDGGYIPRILFFNPNGELLKDVINEAGNPQYKHYYYDVDSIVASMERVIRMFKNTSDRIDQNQNTVRDELGTDKAEL